MRLGRRAAVRVEFRPNEMWVGARRQRHGFLVDLWVSIIPMLPLHLVLLLPSKDDPSEYYAGARVYPAPADHGRDPGTPFELPPELREAERRGRAWLNPRGAT